MDFLGSGPERPPAYAQSAFHEVHGPRVHGFALLLSLGDRASAERLAARALNTGAEYAQQLGYPRRAGVWLRSRILRSVRRSDATRQPFGVRLEALKPLAVQSAALSGLAILTTRERGALIAEEVERLDRRDVEAILALNGTALERLICDARRRYAEAYGWAVRGMPEDVGPLVTTRPSQASDIDTSDLHRAFGDCIATGAHGEIEPELAQHASECRICLRFAASLDALRMINPSAAGTPFPTAIGAPTPPMLSMGSFRAAIGASAAMLIAAVLATNVGDLRWTSADGFVLAPEDTPRQEVVAEVGEPTPASFAALVPAAPGTTSSSSSLPTEPPPTIPMAPVAPIDSSDPTTSPLASDSPIPTSSAAASAFPDPTATVSSAAPSIPPTQTPTPDPTPTPTPTNTAPVAAADNYTADAGVLTVLAPGVLENDTDADGNALTAVLVTPPSSGTLVFNADGSFIYTADPLVSEELISFEYRASDGSADSLVVSVTITLAPIAPEDDLDAAGPG